SNLLLAFITLAIVLPLIALTDAPVLVFTVIEQFAWLNIVLFTFNLIPIPPLDGSKIIAGFLPDNLYEKFISYERFGSIIFIILIVTGMTSRIISPIANGIFDIFFRIALRVHIWGANFF
ncbi:MAG: site-2 protease family protein, partial [Lachnospiraceae bacterium]|nr:site-2 protease family protein [Lachnospiraceae bacterium]